MNQFGIFTALLQRDLKVFSTTVKDMLINGSFFVTFQITTLCYLLPAMGAPQERILPTFLGVILILLTSITFQRSFRLMLDLHKNKFIDYQITLPLSKPWFIAEFIVMSFVEYFIQLVIPYTLCSILLVRHLFIAAPIWWPALVGIMLATLFYFSTLSLAVCFGLNFTWFSDNIWPRLLTPLLFLAPTYKPLGQIYEANHLIGTLLLCNPMTYAIEGFRIAVLAQPSIVTFAQCISALFILSTLNLVLLTIGMRKNLDPV